MTEVLLIVVGAVIGLLASWAQAWIDRETSASNDLYKQRVEALNTVWRAFLPVKTIYASKISLGHENWIRTVKGEAVVALDTFRARIDENQVLLPKEVLAVLRDIDAYLYNVLSEKDQAPSDYVARLNEHLATLSAVANKALSKRTHVLDLELRT